VLQLRRMSHLSKACPKPPRERETSGGRRGGRDYRANLTVAEGEKAGVVFTEEDKISFEILRRKKIAAGNGDKKSVSKETSTSSFPWGNTATYVHPTKGTDNTCSCLYIHR
jgi:hypothetical protein